MTEDMLADFSLKEFPFIFWENTAEGKKALAEAQNALVELKRRYSNAFLQIDSRKWSFDCDGFAQILFNGRKRTEDDTTSPDLLVPGAIEHARRFCTQGWWTINALEQLARSQGPCFVTAMYDLGYRKASKKGKWVQANGAPRPQYTLPRLAPEENHVIPNVWTRELKRESGRTWTANAGLSGLLYLLPDSDEPNTIGAHVAKTQLTDGKLTAKPFSNGTKRFLNIQYQQGSKITIHYWPEKLTTDELLKVARALKEHEQERKYF
ncbi:MAG: hypothetical protein Q7K43_03950 [Candidatus Woesearchaeota archaeon]|nr:hypothetical protein [Candidatus Woesearchaeota archaeon]